MIYPLLSDNERTSLLRILAKKIIVNSEGKIIDQELNSPFVYLKSILDNYSNKGSSWVQYRPQEPFDGSVERFFVQLHLELRGKLAE